MKDQTQKSGDKSTNIQAESITIQQGASISEVRQIALDIFRANFFELAGEAKKIARTRAEEVTESFLKKLKDEHIEGMNQAQDPDFQHALFTVQKEYARNGDKELGELLVDLLVDRTKQESRSILQIVLNESLSVAPKLTQDQLAALSVIFLFKYSAHPGINNQKSLWDLFDQIVSPFASLLTDKTSCYQHLEYSGCGTVGIGAVNLANTFRINYGGLFSKGFDKPQFQNKQFTLPLEHPIFCQCLNDPTHYQVNGLNETVVKSQIKTYGVSDEESSKLLALYNETIMNDEEMKTVITTARPYMSRVFEIWIGSQMKSFTLTSVGIAIGHANVKKNSGEFTDLSIWIN